MKSELMVKTISALTAAVFMMGALAGCGKAAEEQETSIFEKVIEEEAVAKAGPEVFDVAFGEQQADSNYQKYTDPKGWSVTYDPAYINVMSQDDEVFFVYTGDCAGSNVIEAYYEPVFSAKDLVDATVKSWGNESAIQTESTFPGTEDETGYLAMLPPTEEGSGLYEAIIARDYKGGCLVFETTGHNSSDDEMDMLVSDNLSMVIDSITFC